MKIVIITILLFLNFGCSNMQKKELAKKPTQFEVNGQHVSEKSYHDYINKLLPEKINWSCDDETDGGTTSYSLKNKEGRMYDVIESYQEKLNIFSIRSK